MYCYCCCDHAVMLALFMLYLLSSCPCVVSCLALVDTVLVLLLSLLCCLPLFLFARHFHIYSPLVQRKNGLPMVRQNNGKASDMTDYISLEAIRWSHPTWTRLRSCPACLRSPFKHDFTWKHAAASSMSVHCCRLVNPRGRLATTILT